MSSTLSLLLRKTSLRENHDLWQTTRGLTTPFKRLAPVMLILGLLAISGKPAHAQCPAVGQSTTCGVVITITNTGASVSFSGQPPYDGNDDQLIGVINNSNLPIHSLELASSLPIFGFDGDGIDAFGIPGNGFDGTGYGGPNAYFTNIDSATATGTVNFIAPIAANGGTGYFSLETFINSATACTSLINNALSGPTLTGSSLLSGPTQIKATFTPNLNHTLSQAAQVCGFTDFDWVQTITRLPDPSPVVARNNGSPIRLTSTSTPFNDPPAGGGYTYETSPDFSFPFYFDPKNGELAGQETPTTLSFSDAPADPCLPGPLGLPGVAWVLHSSIRAICSNSLAPRGSSLGFKTHLAGVLPDGTAQDLGIGFTWADSFNGTFGGIATTKNTKPVDPGSGQGGAAISTVQKLTTYNSIVIMAQNGVPSGAVFDTCLQDDHTGDTLKFNSQTGLYVYTRCRDKFTLTGTGIVNIANGMESLSDSGSDRRISAGFNPGQMTGRANITLILAAGVYQTIVVNQTKPHVTCSCP
ncbi:MAG: hypothetical protein ACREDR_12040 [Blastocatellia bacterium]